MNRGSHPARRPWRAPTIWCSRCSAVDTDLYLNLLGKGAQLACFLPTNTGEARIQKAVLGQLPAGAYQTQALTAQRSDVAAGDFAVRVYAVGPVYNAAKTQAFAASIQLQ